MPLCQAYRNSSVCMTKAMCLLLLLLLLTVNCLRVANAQSIDDGTIQTCGMTSVGLDPYSLGDAADYRYESLMRKFSTADAERRQCPRDMVCAQKLVAIQDTAATYSEECWEKYQITEYTEIACYEELCNYNLTFGQLPEMKRRYFARGYPIKCYNHGQLDRMNNYRRVIQDYEYSYRFRHPMPVSHWSQGMCGAAIYASLGRSVVIHERVLTGDRKQKFALLRLCPRSGCDRAIVRQYLRNGFKEGVHKSR